jgi:hypothetical protein
MRIDMPKVNFSYDINSDVKNWNRILKNFKNNPHDISDSLVLSFLPPKMKTAFKENVLSDKMIKDFVKSDAKQHKFHEKTITTLEKNWHEIEPSFFKALIKLTNKEIEAKQYTAQLTTASLCPYDLNHNWFMVNAFHNTEKQIAAVAHELFHLHFLFHFGKKTQKKLSNNNAQKLTEALTFLLNTKPLSDILPAKDKGYSSHNKLRKQLAKHWEENQNFLNLIECGVQILSKEKEPKDGLKPLTKQG